MGNAPVDQTDDQTAVRTSFTPKEFLIGRRAFGDTTGKPAENALGDALEVEAWKLYLATGY